MELNPIIIFHFSGPATVPPPITSLTLSLTSLPISPLQPHGPYCFSNPSSMLSPQTFQLAVSSACNTLPQIFAHLFPRLLYKSLLKCLLCSETLGRKSQFLPRWTSPTWQPASPRTRIPRDNHAGATVSFITYPWKSLTISSVYPISLTGQTYSVWEKTLGVFP